MPRITEIQQNKIEPKRDDKGRFYREARCPNCQNFFFDEYIKVGRIRIPCQRCGKIVVMVFRPYKKSDGRPREEIINYSNENGSK